MPQMMPLNWMLLFVFFSVLLIYFNILNFYITYYKPKYKLQSYKAYNKTMNWKW
uniref:ATP synthase complex subunit 8 n=1 Tax=Schizocephala bicornis TaxID=444990 RepID=A0A343UN88_9NEOP|nr:ATP synthase F0 subunit 8 [Schizocephala bicornis]AVE15738.1 ATP synthase F0 subunit 8 [Schizocephala bicornis]